ncbi:non-lysosomal glucosylceramidase [Desulfovibrio sp. OttesenSCG-928-I05]|nr:non-lysosomal glucosylceramidase [Desulfovibrio sp. OttesenSCG-928-I05]
MDQQAALLARLALAERGGAIRTGLEESGVWARTYSHDDGPFSGLFLGGVGTPSFGRDMDGAFRRWHLEPGVHIRHAMEEAGFLVAWEHNGEKGCFPLDVRAIGGSLSPESAAAAALADAEKPLTSACACAPVPGMTRRACALWPFLYEVYDAPSLPFSLVLESFSPLLQSGDALRLPLAFFAVHFLAKAGSGPVNAGVCFSWPNLLGWRAAPQSSYDRGGMPWPAQYSAGNSCAAVPLPMPSSVSDEPWRGRAALQTRRTVGSASAPLEGEALVFAASRDEGWQFSEESCVKAGQNRIGRPPARQEHTLAWAREHFARTLTLPGSGASWEAHWDESLASLLSASRTLAGGEYASLLFGLAMDCPFTAFGKGRLWKNRYTREFGTGGNDAQGLARHALEHFDDWRDTLAREAEVHYERYAPALGDRVAGALRNELYFLNGGGSAWVDAQADAHPPAAPVAAPVLGDGEHFAFLEGFDIGYFYYNTLDLWVYAFSALSVNFPELADSVFRDYLKTIPLTLPAQRVIYRDAAFAPLLVPGKLPHDLGAAPEDPWHDLNGYQMRDDSNAWLDHNPTFIISYFLHCRLTGKTPPPHDWAALKEAFAFMRAQAEGEKGVHGLPLHRAFGDSTWDNIGLKGVCAHSGSAVLAASAAMAAWAEDFGETEYAAAITAMLPQAVACFESRLWNGEYYRACDEGRYAACIMPDSLMWLMYAEQAGLPPLLPQERVRSHIRAAHAYAYKRHGFHGPLLICEPDNGSFPPDGGDIGLQVNEVILGAAWAAVAHAYHVGLPELGREMAEDMSGYLHGRAGLLGRSPAAWDSRGFFRAPLNMRPLAIWLLSLTAGGAGSGSGGRGTAS